MATTIEIPATAAKNFTTMAEWMIQHLANHFTDPTRQEQLENGQWNEKLTYRIPYEFNAQKGREADYIAAVHVTQLTRSWFSFMPDGPWDKILGAMVADRDVIGVDGPGNEAARRARIVLMRAHKTAREGHLNALRFAGV